MIDHTDTLRTIDLLEESNAQVLAAIAHGTHSPAEIRRMYAGLVGSCESIARMYREIGAYNDANVADSAASTYRWRS